MECTWLHRTLECKVRRVLKVFHQHFDNKIAANASIDVAHVHRGLEQQFLVVRIFSVPWQGNSECSGVTNDFHMIRQRKVQNIIVTGWPVQGQID